MKKSILFIVIIFQLLINTTQAQLFDYTYQDNILTTSINNGCGIPTKVQFKITQNTLDSIKQSKLFINSEFYIKNSTNKQVLTFILLETNMSIIQKKYSLYNTNSFEFINNSVGDIIFFNETIKILFYYKAQNKIGNYIMDNSCIYIYLENNVKKYLFL